MRNSLRLFGSILIHLLLIQFSLIFLFFLLDFWTSFHSRTSWVGYLHKIFLLIQLLLLSNLYCLSYSAPTGFARFINELLIANLINISQLSFFFLAFTSTDCSCSCSSPLLSLLAYHSLGFFPAFPESISNSYLFWIFLSGFCSQSSFFSLHVLTGRSHLLLWVSLLMLGLRKW